jgi:GNAT superfamily N-acetyltransferase
MTGDGHAELYEPKRLRPEHQTTGFDCGVPSLNAWLTRSANVAQSKGVAAVDVWTRAERVVAYYAISPTSTSAQGLPTSASTDLSLVPSYLLGKLALDRSLHGHNLGARLLAHAMWRVLDAADRAGGRLLVVDAIDDAAVGFYEHFGFIRVSETMRLYMKVSTIRAALERDN